MWVIRGQQFDKVVVWVEEVFNEGGDGGISRSGRWLVVKLSFLLIFATLDEGHREPGTGFMSSGMVDVGSVWENDGTVGR